MTTLREYSLIILLLLALAATFYMSIGQRLTELTEGTVARIERVKVRR